MKLKILRKSKDISQTNLADEIDVSQGTISGWESGAYEPNISQLIQLADLFDVSIDYLVGRSDERK